MTAFFLQIGKVISRKIDIKIVCSVEIGSQND
jgi:hypothetical protein